MFFRIIMLLNLAAYSFIAAQSLMYIIALDDLQRKLPVRSYIQFRQILDGNFRARFRYPFYCLLITLPLLCVISLIPFVPVVFFTSFIGWLGFLTDALLMIRGNLPINRRINNWSLDDFPKDWEQYRDRWLQIFQYRQVANLLGFVSLLVGAVFQP